MHTLHMHIAHPYKLFINQGNHCIAPYFMQSTELISKVYDTNDRKDDYYGF